MELSNEDKSRMLEENETKKYLEILEADTIKQVEMKLKKKEEYLRRTRKHLVAKLYNRNLIKETNTWPVPLEIYLRPFLNLTREELKQI